MFGVSDGFFYLALAVCLIGFLRPALVLPARHATGSKVLRVYAPWALVVLLFSFSTVLGIAGMLLSIGLAASTLSAKRHPEQPPPLPVVGPVLSEKPRSAVHHSVDTRKPPSLTASRAAELDSQQAAPRVVQPAKSRAQRLRSNPVAGFHRVTHLSLELASSNSSGR